ncbi:MAG TPA: SDR family oxidoreductase [Burkholderiaceae bacterium]|nr:SDR family oxidoreductase [Burkholderiaceae bacterium]
MPTPHHPDAQKPDSDAPQRRAARGDGPRPVALVTGAARRIGRVIALELAHAGFDIALHHRGADARSLDDAESTALELRAAGARAQLFPADFADPAATAALVPAIAQRLGRVDAVVNSASRFEYDSPESFDAALLASLTRSNVAAPVELARALAAQVRAQPAHVRVTPCVVNLLDQKLHNPNPDYFSYTLTKAALAHATVLLAQALAPAVRVCGVSPGITLVSGPMDEEEFARAHRLTALGRSSTPEDIARAVRFLVESPAITGVDLAVDGGQHLVGQPRDVLFLARRNDAPTLLPSLPLEGELG